MISRLRLTWRVLLVLATIFGFLVEAAFRESFYSRDEVRLCAARSRAVSRWARFLLGSLGFTVRLGVQDPQQAPGALLVANHLSFWDVVAIASRMPVLFVTSVEIRQTPVLGWLAMAAGCIFVERRVRSGKAGEREEVARALRSGNWVVLFPEATSTDGSSVLPFKRSFFSPAIETGKPVVPVCINYPDIDGRPADRLNRDRVFYYGDQKFHTQLLRALSLRSLVISLEVLAPIPTLPGVTDREWLVQQSYEAVLSRFLPVKGEI